jgi:hypothetical protein
LEKIGRNHTKHRAIEWADAASLHYPATRVFLTEDPGVHKCDLKMVETQEVPGALIQPRHNG